MAQTPEQLAEKALSNIVHDFTRMFYAVKVADAIRQAIDEEKQLCILDAWDIIRWELEKTIGPDRVNEEGPTVPAAAYCQVWLKVRINGRVPIQPVCHPSGLGVISLKLLQDRTRCLTREKNLPLSSGCGLLSMLIPLCRTERRPRLRTASCSYGEKGNWCKQGNQPESPDRRICR
jgi:hypothetical protein